MELRQFVKSNSRYRAVMLVDQFELNFSMSNLISFASRLSFLSTLEGIIIPFLFYGHHVEQYLLTYPGISWAIRSNSFTSQENIPYNVVWMYSHNRINRISIIRQHNQGRTPPAVLCGGFAVGDVVFKIHLYRPWKKYIPEFEPCLSSISPLKTYFSAGT